MKLAKFIKTAVLPKDYPTIRDEKGRILPEIAVGGRSNVGKSSLLNHLFHSKNLVKTSATPGKTQTLNFFTLDDTIAFADLPGYGYAKVPQAVQEKWDPMIRTYFEKRSTLDLVLFLLDIRRIPNDQDLQFFNWVLEFDKQMILVLTKVDKVSTNECHKNTEKILSAFGASNLHYVHYSVLKNKGKPLLLKLIREALSISKSAVNAEEENDDSA